MEIDKVERFLWTLHNGSTCLIVCNMLDCKQQIVLKIGSLLKHTVFTFMASFLHQISVSILSY